MTDFTMSATPHVGVQVMLATCLMFLSYKTMTDKDKGNNYIVSKDYRNKLYMD